MTASTPYLLMALVGALLYALSATVLRSASGRGTEPAWSVLACNAAVALALTFFFDAAAWRETAWLPALALGCLFFLGQLFTLLSLEKGAASVTAQVLGVKVVLVAALAMLLGSRAPSPPVLLGGLLSAVGVSLLNRPEAGSVRLLSPCVAYALAAALVLSTFDTLVAHWSAAYGFGRAVPPGMWCAAALSLLFFAARRRPGGAPLWNRRIGVGALLMGLQAVCFVSAIGYSGDAAGCNIAYGSRGLWALVLAAPLGKLLGEGLMHRAPVGRQQSLLGAGCIFVSICLVFL